MPEYDNTNSGVIFKNHKKEKDTHPDSTGSLNVDGVDYWVNAWNKTSKNGVPYLSLSVKRKDAAQAPTSESTAQDDFADPDMPF